MAKEDEILFINLADNQDIIEKYLNIGGEEIESIKDIKNKSEINCIFVQNNEKIFFQNI
jgi:hypothetical protein